MVDEIDSRSQVLNQMIELQNTAEDLSFTMDLSLDLFQNSPDAIVVVVGETGVIQLVNKQLEFLSGYHRSELRGKPIETLVPEGKKERHKKQHRPNFMCELRMRPMGVGLDLKLRHKSSEEIPVDINLSPVVTMRGVYVIATIRRKEVIGGVTNER